MPLNVLTTILTEIHYSSNSIFLLNSQVSTTCYGFSRVVFFYFKINRISKGLDSWERNRRVENDEDLGLNLTTWMVIHEISWIYPLDKICLVKNGYVKTSFFNWLQKFICKNATFATLICYWNTGVVKSSNVQQPLVSGTTLRRIYDINSRVARHLYQTTFVQLNKIHAQFEMTIRKLQSLKQLSDAFYSGSRDKFVKTMQTVASTSLVSQCLQIVSRENLSVDVCFTNMPQFLF